MKAEFGHDPDWLAFAFKATFLALVIESECFQVWTLPKHRQDSFMNISHVIYICQNKEREFKCDGLLPTRYSVQRRGFGFLRVSSTNGEAIADVPL